MPFDDEVREAGGSPLESQRYVLKLLRIEDAEPGEFGPSFNWIFNVMDPTTMTVIRREDGGSYEYFQFTGTSLRVPKPGGRSSKQFRWASALLGRSVVAGESGTAISQEIVGRYMEAMIAPNDNGNMAILVVDPIGKNYPKIKAALDGKAVKSERPESEPATDIVGVTVRSDDLDF